MTTSVKIAHGEERWPIDLIVRTFTVDEKGNRTQVAEKRLSAGDSTHELFAYKGLVFEVSEDTPEPETT